MHLTYAEEIDQKELMQGDVLMRTPALDALLKEVHPHFYNDKRNIYFIVLTQSCDLVIRDADGCKSPYIVIAPVRSLDLVVERFINQFKSTEVRAGLPVLNMKANNKLREFLDRLFNNNETSFFYLHSEGASFPQGVVAYLNLSIAIRSNLHFQTCLDAKVLQLTDTFQAKLGWLVGQLYSRVGTKDWDRNEVNKKIKSMLPDVAIWVDDNKVRELESKFKKSGKPEWSRDDISKALLEMPTRKQAVVQQAGSIGATVLEGVSKTATSSLRRALLKDDLLSSLIESATGSGDVRQAEQDDHSVAQPGRKGVIVQRIEVLVAEVLAQAHADTASKLRRRLEDDQVLTQICGQG